MPSESSTYAGVLTQIRFVEIEQCMITADREARFRLEIEHASRVRETFPPTLNKALQHRIDIKT